MNTKIKNKKIKYKHVLNDLYKFQQLHEFWKHHMSLSQVGLDKLLIHSIAYMLGSPVSGYPWIRNCKSTE